MRHAVICAVLIVGAARPGFAQAPWEGRARLAINVGVQPDTTRLSESITLTKNAEPAPVTASMARKILPVFDAGVMVRLAGNFGASVSMSLLSGKGDADVAAQIPHPFFFNQPRAVTGKAHGVSHGEIAAHTDLVYVLVFDHIDLAVSAGASFFRVDQDLVSDIIYTEAYPYDTAAFASATLTRVTVNRVGYNGGADVTWKASPRWGVGALIRYSRARVPLTVNGLNAGSVDAGGLQATGGLRLMF